MLRSRFAPALAGVALCSLLVAGCGQNRVPSKTATVDNVHDELVAQGVADADATDVANCVADGLFDSGDFSEDQRSEVLRATNGDPPAPALTAKVEALVNGCAHDAGIEIPADEAAAG